MKLYLAILFSLSFAFIHLKDYVFVLKNTAETSKHFNIIPININENEKETQKCIQYFICIYAYFSDLKLDFIENYS